MGAFLAACGGGEPDGRDEAGAPDDTRTELIYVEGDTSAPTPPPRVDAEPAEADEPTAATDEAATPPAPTAEDEVGGDDLLAYAADGEFVVQVGTFRDAARASRRVSELEKLGYPAFAVAHPAGGQVRVRIGYFATRDEADRFGLRFQKDHGGTYWVAERTKEVAAR